MHPQRVEELLQKAQLGDAQAQGQALEECRAFLLRLAGQELNPSLKSKANPSDLVQETMIVAMKHFHQFKGVTQKELLLWVRRILLHRLWNLARAFQNTAKRNVQIEANRMSRQEAEKQMIHFMTPSREAMASEKAQRIDLIISQMPEDYRRVIQWRYQERLEFEEIALKMGRSVAAVRKLWSRAVAHLQKNLD